MNKLEFDLIVKMNDKVNPWKMTKEEHFINTIIESCRDAFGCYENSCSDEGYTLEEANGNFYKTVNEAIDGIHKEIRYELDRQSWYIRFKGNNRIDELILAYIKYSCSELLNCENIDNINDEDLKQVKINFKNSWVYKN